jgi:hypothetical protein
MNQEPPTMDRDDAEQEHGRTLQSTDWIRLVARDEAEKAIVQHLHLCPLNSQEVISRVRAVEITLSRLIGLMIGSGIAGGATSTFLTHLLK